MRQCGRHVVKEDADTGNTHGQQRFKLGHQHVDLTVVGVVEIESRTHGEGEKDAMTGGGIGQRIEATQRDSIVGRTPIVAVKLIILGRVDVGVEFMGAHKAEHVQPLFVGPRRSIKSFDDAAQFVAHGVSFLGARGGRRGPREGSGEMIP